MSPASRAVSWQNSLDLFEESSFIHRDWWDAAIYFWFAQPKVLLPPETTVVSNGHWKP